MLKRHFRPMSAVVGLLLIGTAHAAVITQTVAVPAQPLIASAASGGNSVDLISVFNQFNPTLGTLTGVQFDFNYNVHFSVTNGGGGFSISGPVKINGTQPSTPGGPATLGGGGGSGVFPVYNSNDTTTTLVISSTFAPYTGSGTVPFDFQSSESFNVGGPPGAQGELDLQASSVTATYTYTPIPEPTSLTLIAASGVVFPRRRPRESRSHPGSVWNK